MPFNQHATSARLEVVYALGRLKAAGRTVVSTMEIVKEVQSLSPEWEYDVIAREARRELERLDPATGKPRMTRVGWGKYRIS